MTNGYERTWAAQHLRSRSWRLQMVAENASRYEKYPGFVALCWEIAAKGMRDLGMVHGAGFWEKLGRLAWIRSSACPYDSCSFPYAPALNTSMLLKMPNGYEALFRVSVPNHAPEYKRSWLKPRSRWRTYCPTHPYPISAVVGAQYNMRNVQLPVPAPGMCGAGCLGRVGLVSP
ncbi:hypothetical protein BDW68DRAFT_149443 [Aspergillus falconensis]